MPEPFNDTDAAAALGLTHQGLVISSMYNRKLLRLSTQDVPVICNPVPFQCGSCVTHQDGIGLQTRVASQCDSCLKGRKQKSSTHPSWRDTIDADAIMQGCLQPFCARTAAVQSCSLWSSHYTPWESSATDDLKITINVANPDMIAAVIRCPGVEQRHFAAELQSRIGA